MRERNLNVSLPLTHPTLGTWRATQAHTLTGNRTGDPLVSQADAQSTEPRQPGLQCAIFCLLWCMKIALHVETTLEASLVLPHFADRKQYFRLKNVAQGCTAS